VGRAHERALSAVSFGLVAITATDAVTRRKAGADEIRYEIEAFEPFAFLRNLFRLLPFQMIELVKHNISLAPTTAPKARALNLSDAVVLDNHQSKSESVLWKCLVLLSPAFFLDCHNGPLK
jgi:hypothetical protein